MFGRGPILNSMLVLALTMTVFANPLQQAEANGGLPWWTWALIVVAVVLLLALLWWFLSRRSAEAYPTSSQAEAQDPPSAVEEEQAKPQFGPEESEVEVDPTFVQPEPVYDAGPTVLEEETVEPDDLKVIEGIGPKIEQVLKDQGIQTYTHLAAMKVPNLREMLEAEGLAGISDPTTWPEQATLAAEGRWEALEKLQDLLQGGRRT